MRVGRPTPARWLSTRADVVGRAQAEVAREAERAGHADRHALAVDQRLAVVMGEALERVAEGVAEIEQRALALLDLVGGDDARLGGAARRDRLQPRRPAGEHRAPVAFEPGEEVAVADQAVFGHLGVAGAELARAQRVEDAGVGEHQRRLVEGADQVLAERRIDRRLAADAGIDLGEQGRRDLHEAHAAPQRSRRRSRRDRR